MRHMKHLTSFAEIFTIWACAWDCVKFWHNPALMNNGVFFPMCKEMPCWVWISLFGSAALLQATAMVSGNRWYRLFASLLCAAVLVKFAWVVKATGRDTIIIGMIIKDAVIAASTFWRIGWEVMSYHCIEVRRIWRTLAGHLSLLRATLHAGLG